MGQSYKEIGKIGVLMGGYSSERKISLKSGKAVFQSLKDSGYDVVALDITDTEYNKIKEVPYIFKNRFVGSSKLNYKEYLKYLLDILRLYHYKINRRWTK